MYEFFPISMFEFKINDALNKSPQQHRMSARGGASERTSTNRNTAFGGIDANFGNVNLQTYTLLYY